MDFLFYGTAVLFATAIWAVGYVTGHRVNKSSYEKMQMDVCDVHDELCYKNKLLIEYKKQWFDVNRHSIEMEDALMQLRKENNNLEQMYDAMKGVNTNVAGESYAGGFKDGHKAGMRAQTKIIGGTLVDESTVLNNGGIVSNAEPVVNQLKNV